MVTVNSLTNTYAAYAARDLCMTALNVVNETTSRKLNLVMTPSQASVPLLDMIKTRMTKRSLRSDTDLFIRASQLAETALVEGCDDPESVATYSQLSRAPNDLEEVLQAYRWDEARNVSRTIQLLTDFIAPTAAEVQKTISQQIEQDKAQYSSQGQVTVFNWGLLGDAMFTHAVINYANQKLNVFDPDQKVTPYYATVAFSHAENNDTLTNALTDDKEIISGYLMMADIDGFDMSVIPYITQSGTLAELTSHLKNDRKDPSVFVKNVETLAQIHGQMLLLTNHMDTHPTDIPVQLAQRVQIASDVLMCLEVAVEALRQTDYASTLIMCTEFPDDAPQTVVLNDDQLDSDMDTDDMEQLVPITSYLSMNGLRKTPTFGYSTSWYNAHREDIAHAAILQREEEDTANETKHIQHGYAIIREQLNNAVTKLGNDLSLSELQLSNARTQVERLVASSRNPEIDQISATADILIEVISQKAGKETGQYLTKLYQAPSTAEFEQVVQTMLVDDMFRDFFTN